LPKSAPCKKSSVMQQVNQADNTVSDILLNDVDGMIYAGFLGAKDKKTLARLALMSGADLNDETPVFEDKRLEGLYFLYRARQFPKTLLAEERVRYDEYVAIKLMSGSPSQYEKYMARLSELAKLDTHDADKRYLLEELALYAHSVVPLDSY
jgi:exodeoxyribonuclease I